MKSRFHTAAGADLTNDVAYYDGAAVGLGDRFLAEVRAAVVFLETYPMAPASSPGKFGANRSFAFGIHCCTPSNRTKW